MSTRIAVLTALAATIAGGLFLRRRPVRDLGTAAKRLGRAAARNVAEDWDALFI